LAPGHRRPSMTSAGYALINGHHQTATRTLASDGTAQGRPAPLQVVRQALSQRKPAAFFLVPTGDRTSKYCTVRVQCWPIGGFGIFSTAEISDTVTKRCGVGGRAAEQQPSWRMAYSSPTAAISVTYGPNHMEKDWDTSQNRTAGVHYPRNLWLVVRHDAEKGAFIVVATCGRKAAW
jgi:hypothetical protein